MAAPTVAALTVAAPLTVAALTVAAPLTMLHGGLVVLVLGTTMLSTT